MRVEKKDDFIVIFFTHECVSISTFIFRIRNLAKDSILSHHHQQPKKQHHKDEGFI